MKCTQTKMLRRSKEKTPFELKIHEICMVACHELDELSFKKNPTSATDKQHVEVKYT